MSARKPSRTTPRTSGWRKTHCPSGHEFRYFPRTGLNYRRGWAVCPRCKDTVRA